MDLTSKKYTNLHSKTGSEKNDMKVVHDGGHLGDIGDNPSDYPMLTTLVYQIQEMQEELDYLRTEISSNKDKTGITTQQASTITANDKAVNNNASEITKNTNAISNQAVEVNAAIKVGAYPPVLNPPVGFTQSHASEIVYDTKQKKYFLNIYYVENTPVKGGKGQRKVRTGQIELKGYGSI